MLVIGQPNKRRSVIRMIKMRLHRLADNIVKRASQSVATRTITALACPVGSFVNNCQGGVYSVTGDFIQINSFHSILQTLNCLLVGTRPQRRMMEDIPCTC